MRLVITPDHRGYLKRRWVSPPRWSCPHSRVGILRHGEDEPSRTQGELRVETILRHHSLFRVLIAAAGTLFLGAWLVLLFEEKQREATFTTTGRSVVGHRHRDHRGLGDRYPSLGGGRAVAMVLMLVGIGLIGVLTATVASVFIKEHTDANKEEFKKGHDELGQQLSVISDRIADVERRSAPPSRNGQRGLPRTQKRPKWADRTG